MTSSKPVLHEKVAIVTGAAGAIGSGICRSLLENGCRVFRTFCVEGMEADEARCRERVENSTAVVTALVGEIGYQAAERVAQAAMETGRRVREIVTSEGLLSEERFDELTSYEAVTRLGS